ncbi:MAG: DNA-binding response regulator [Bacteroidia bacterium 44-10]|nr:MAG: DNA-binding response regulator [Bacteroidia bacterium 44-10]
MKVLIVEDETVAVDNLRTILADLAPEIEIAGITESVSQTVRWLGKNHPPDLIFMDIHLSDGSAFNIFSAVTVEIPIIFITAYDEYAIEAFRVNSIDYILKPIDPVYLKRALDKYHKLGRTEIYRYLSKMPDLTLVQGYPERLLIPINDKLLPVSLGQVSCFYTSSDDTKVFMRNGKSYPYRKTLDSIMSTLNPKEFFRANKQFIVAKKSVKDITIWFDNRLLLTLDTAIPERIYVSKNRASEFRQWIVE